MDLFEIKGLKEIPITDIENVYIGQTEDPVGMTGVTVIASKEGFAAGMDVRGGGPASREGELLKPLAAAHKIHAVVLGGGSAFGLAAAGGVMKYMEEHDIGYDVGITKVPLVVQSDIFDLGIGDYKARPDEAMGYEATRRAFEEPNYRDGSFGAGCGATVGKVLGMEYSMKSGIGSFAVEKDGLKIGAIVVVNAIGDVFDHKTGKKIAGLLNEDKTGFRSAYEVMGNTIRARDNKFTDNTTIGVVITNAKFDKSQLSKIAGMAHDGYARSISPVHTSADGDTIYAVSTGEITADQDLVGVIAAEVMSETIKKAVCSACI